jgi:ferredoxin-NADP reductase
MPSHSEQTLRLRVAAKHAIADGVVALTLADPAGRPLPGWTPGAHIDLTLAPGLARQYSLCGDPADPHSWRVAVLREASSRGGSHYIHHQLAVGDLLDARGPRNHFALEPAAGYLFIAGGIGITPILPMITAARTAGAPWRLIYGGRARASMAFIDDLAVHGDAVQLWPQDERGLIDLASALSQAHPDSLIYCCGPEPLLTAVSGLCGPARAAVLRTERFTPITPDPGTVNTSFEVQLQRSGLVLTVAPGQSILAAVEAARIPVLSSCLEGTCGTCETNIIAGAADHRDSVLTDAERAANTAMMICISRAASPRLVLDL